MARPRDRLIAEQEQARAARPADPPRTAPRSPAVAFPPDLLEDLVAFAERGGAAEGDELPEGLAARACEALAGGPMPRPGPPTARGASAARAQAALGRAGALAAALRANDLGVADRTMAAMEEAIGVAVPPEFDAVARRAALRVLIDVPGGKRALGAGRVPPVAGRPRGGREDSRGGPSSVRGGGGGARRARAPRSPAPGPHLPRDTKCWIPLVAPLSSACLEELLQLRPRDVYRKDGVDVIDIGAEGAQAKTFARPRLVPVHSQLRRLGFLEQVDEMRAKGEALLFPGFAPAGPDDRMSHAFTRFWTEYRCGVGAHLRGADLHACRHAVNTNLLNRFVPEAVIKHVLGHAQQGMTGRDYNSGVGLEAAADAIGRLAHDCIDFAVLEAKAGRRA
jgi:hypothetical protein